MVEPLFNQMQVQPQIGVDFENGVRTLMPPGDPDIIMVGEIRDLATAEMAVQAGALDRPSGAFHPCTTTMRQPRSRGLIDLACHLIWSIPRSSGDGPAIGANFCPTCRARLPRRSPMMRMGGADQTVSCDQTGGDLSGGGLP